MTGSGSSRNQCQGQEKEQWESQQIHSWLHESLKGEKEVNGFIFTMWGLGRMILIKMRVVKRRKDLKGREVETQSGNF